MLGSSSEARSQDRFSQRFLICCIDCGIKVVDCFMKGLGPVLITLCCSLISYVVFIYFKEVLPVAMYTYGPLSTELLTAFGLYWLFNIFFNYFSVIFIDPGMPLPELAADTKAELSRDPDLNPRKRSHTESDHRFCNKCDAWYDEFADHAVLRLAGNVIKPMRTHHCSVCKRCVLKMDHHCPWINNCVGWRNARYFYLFLFYLSTGAIYFLLMSAPMVWPAMSGRMKNDPYLIAAILCFSACIAAGLFLGWNVYLITTNQTTIEFYGNHFDTQRPRNTKQLHPFDCGLQRNIYQIFGDSNPFFWIAPSWRLPPGNGCVFPLRDDFFPLSAAYSRIDGSADTMSASTVEVMVQPSSSGKSSPPISPRRAMPPAPNGGTHSRLAQLPASAYTSAPAWSQASFPPTSTVPASSVFRAAPMPVPASSIPPVRSPFLPNSSSGSDAGVRNGDEYDDNGRFVYPSTLSAANPFSKSSTVARDHRDVDLMPRLQQMRQQQQHQSQPQPGGLENAASLNSLPRGLATGPSTALAPTSDSNVAASASSPSTGLSRSSSGIRVVTDGRSSFNPVA